MNITKFTLPLLAATILAGCGNEVKLSSPKGESDFRSAEILVFPKQENSVFNPEFLSTLENSLLANQEVAVLNHFYEDDKNLRTAAVKELETRIDFVMGLNLSKETKAKLLTQLNSLHEHQSKLLAFEESLTDEDFWEHYAKTLPNEVALLKPLSLRMSQFNEHMKPFIDARNEAGVKLEKARYATIPAEEALVAKMVEYGKSYDLDLRDSEYRVFKHSYIYEPVNKQCKVESAHNNPPLQTIYSEITGKCHYVFIENATYAKHLGEHKENLDKLVKDNSAEMVKAEITRSETVKIYNDAEDTIKAQEKIANKKFEDIGEQLVSAKVSLAASTLVGQSSWYYDSTSHQWKDKNDKRYPLAVADLRKANGLDADYPNLKTDLTKKQLFEVYQELLSREAEAAQRIEVSEKGFADFEPQGEQIKVLVTSKDSEFRSYKLLSDSTDKDGNFMLVAKEYGGRPLEAQPLALRTQAQRSGTSSIEKATDAFIRARANELRSRIL